MIIFIPLLVSVINYKKYPVALKNITWYLVVSAASQILSYILWKQHKRNLPILHIYTMAEYLVLVSFYSIILKGFLAKKIFPVLAALGLVFFVVDTVFIENIYKYNTYARSAEALVFIFLSMCWYIKIVSVTPEDIVLVNTLKYINSAFLIYFSGSLILFSLSNIISNLSLAMKLNIWTLHTSFAFLLYLLIAIGLWKYRKQ
jgi:hypothetical protein